MNKYLLKDIEKALKYFEKMAQVHMVIEKDELGRLLLKASDIVGSPVTITIFDESSQKFPEVNKTERL